jgi:hypothetical protein
MDEKHAYGTEQCYVENSAYPNEVLPLPKYDNGIAEKKSDNGISTEQYITGYAGSIMVPTTYESCLSQEEIKRYNERQKNLKIDIPPEIDLNSDIQLPFSNISNTHQFAKGKSVHTRSSGVYNEQKLPAHNKYTDLSLRNYNDQIKEITDTKYKITWATSFVCNILVLLFFILIFEFYYEIYYHFSILIVYLIIFFCEIRLVNIPRYKYHGLFVAIYALTGFVVLISFVCLFLEHPLPVLIFIDVIIGIKIISCIAVYKTTKELCK